MEPSYIDNNLDESEKLVTKGESEWIEEDDFWAETESDLYIN